jgi:aminoglycoside 6'-N-acetyltransferase I
MDIVELTIERRDLVDDAARLLHETFLTRTADWQNLESARQEVLDSLAPDRISRVAVSQAGAVVGWIGGISMYGGHVWEIHPLVVAAHARRRGLGRALVADLERTVRERGALTLWVGSDDENDETSLSGADLYGDVPGAIRSIRNLAGHPYEFYLRIGFTIAGVVPDANGPGKPDILLAKPVRRAG